MVEPSSKLTPGQLERYREAYAVYVLVTESVSVDFEPEEASRVLVEFWKMQHSLLYDKHDLWPANLYQIDPVSGNIFEVAELD